MNGQDNPKPLTDTISDLQSELKKIEDLNELANRYRDVAGSMIIALNDLLENEKLFRDDIKLFKVDAEQNILTIKESLQRSLSSLSALNGELEKNQGTLTSHLLTFEKSVSSFASLMEQQTLSVKEHIKQSEETLAKSISDSIKAETMDMRTWVKEEENLLNQILKDCNENHFNVITNLSSLEESVKTFHNSSANSILNHSNSLTSKMSELHKLGSDNQIRVETLIRESNRNLLRRVTKAAVFSCIATIAILCLAEFVYLFVF